MVWYILRDIIAIWVIGTADHGSDGAFKPQFIKCPTCVECTKQKSQVVYKMRDLVTWIFTPSILGILPQNECTGQNICHVFPNKAMDDHLVNLCADNYTECRIMKYRRVFIEPVQSKFTSVSGQPSWHCRHPLAPAKLGRENIAGGFSGAAEPAMYLVTSCRPR